jgi:hypothetical protein
MPIDSPSVTGRVSRIALLTALAACIEPSVEWRAPERSTTARHRMAVDSSGSVSEEGMRVHEGSTVVAPGVGVCVSSVRSVWSGGRLHATWWNVRSDSSASLLAATSADSGKSWQAPAVVDSSDRADVGCSRPPPAIEGSGASVYIVYSMRAPEGTGVFFSHSMEQGGKSMFHSPVTVIYGDRLVEVAVSVDGDRVAVAYGDPSSRSPRVGLSLSRTQGHAFETHLDASISTVSATEPDVAIRGSFVAVGWKVPGDERMVRIGRMR